MKTRGVTHRELAELLDQLDHQAMQQSHRAASSDPRVNRRRCDRRPFRTRCTVTWWDTLVAQPADMHGRTRNLSRFGFSVLAPREFAADEPVEVRFSLAGRSPLFMSGLVRFCRYAGRGYYELGVSMQHTGDVSVFALLADDAGETLAWLREAIEAI